MLRTFALYCSEIAPKEIEDGEILFPTLKHVESEEKPTDRKKSVPDIMEMEEPLVYELMFKRRQSQV